MAGQCPWVCLCLLCFGISEVIGQEESLPRLDTSYGKLLGRRVHVKDSTQPVWAYFGVPFAEPPVGALRFTAPRPAREWQGLRDATAYPPLCLQNMDHSRQLVDIYAGRFPAVGTSEDCLYLNVYTPVKPGQPDRLPVMVWIHGGGFLMGGASLYDGSSLAAFGDVVVVVIQYRLGIPGFLSTGDSQIPENLGLQDQVCALRWVQETIHSFGGDPGSVTIFGESAGGASVFLHMLSPVSSRLFHRAITQSGVLKLPLFTQTDAKASAQLIAQKAGCSSADSADIVRCLMSKTAQEIEAVTPRLGDLVLTISKDGVFVPKNTEELEKMNFRSLPWMIGINVQEFGWMLPNMILFPGWELGLTRQTMAMVLGFILQNSDLPPNAQEIIEDEYFGDIEDPARVRDIFLDLMGDLSFLVPSVNAARLHRDAGSPIFFYEFQQRPSMFGQGRPEFVKADHFDEVGFVLGAPFWTEEIVMLENTTQEERQLSRIMMKYWSNFAKTGNPNGPGLFGWPEFTIGEEHLLLNVTVKLGNLKGKNRVEFWNEDLPKRLKSGSDNRARTEL
ncbi:fatty acyl-CoA hydrolase precursor, medium chain-like isoform X1 [Conger conger]|uniref:fatty acyl-CoA hydrolase precursor, medium chain-like isoform X1 n=1 Tax=Conger conger TaxID=82655 RepID=UPI002A5A72B0|nr:fatty acyl-CoA hydrolase precursor, medium chain-like isoform X1 [Conger conger]